MFSAQNIEDATVFTTAFRTALFGHALDFCPILCYNFFDSEWS